MPSVGTWLPRKRRANMAGRKRKVSEDDEFIDFNGQLSELTEDDYSDGERLMAGFDDAEDEGELDFG